MWRIRWTPSWLTIAAIGGDREKDGGSSGGGETDMVVMEMKDKVDATQAHDRWDEREREVVVGVVME